MTSPSRDGEAGIDESMLRVTAKHSLPKENQFQCLRLGIVSKSKLDALRARPLGVYGQVSYLSS